jgi:ATP/maltotriose-dependent transcriptional regulator MalT
LASEKKKAKVWQNAEAAMKKLKVPDERIAHLMKAGKPELLAELVRELQAKQ